MQPQSDANTADGISDQVPQTVSFELTHDDIAALCAFNHAEGPAHPARLGCGIVLLVFGLFIGAHAVAGLSSGDSGAAIAIVLTVPVAIIGIALLGGSRASRTGQAKEKAAQLVRSGYGRLALRAYDVTISPERFSSRTDLSELHTNWIGVFAIRLNRAGSHAFVYTGPSAAIIIPARAFDTREQFEQFVGLMRTYRKEAPSLLSQCPACDYDLHGTMIDRCPECGWTPPDVEREL